MWLIFVRLENLVVVKHMNLAYHLSFVPWVLVNFSVWSSHSLVQYLNRISMLWIHHNILKCCLTVNHMAGIHKLSSSFPNNILVPKKLSCSPTVKLIAMGWEFLGSNHLPSIYPKKVYLLKKKTIYWSLVFGELKGC